MKNVDFLTLRDVILRHNEQLKTAFCKASYRLSGKGILLSRLSYNGGMRLHVLYIRGLIPVNEMTHVVL